jgi:hypothetical protein
MQFSKVRVKAPAAEGQVSATRPDLIEKRASKNRTNVDEKLSGACLGQNAVVCAGIQGIERCFDVSRRAQLYDRNCACRTHIAAQKQSVQVIE